MVEAKPVPSLVVAPSQLPLHLFVVPLDAPPNRRQTDQLPEGGVLRYRGQPVLRRFLFASRPMDQEPLPWPRFASSHIPVSRSHAQRRVSRRHHPASTFAPPHGPPAGCRQSQGQRPDRDRAIARAPAPAGGHCRQACQGETRDHPDDRQKRRLRADRRRSPGDLPHDSGDPLRAGLPAL